jgi:hypothetical protein
MDFSQWGKGIALAGLGLTLLGGLLWVFGKVPFLGRLPGDIRFERPSFSFYFPLTTCLLLSALVTFVIWIFSKLK